MKKETNGPGGVYAIDSSIRLGSRLSFLPVSNQFPDSTDLLQCVASSCTSSVGLVVRHPPREQQTGDQTPLSLCVLYQTESCQ